MSTVKYRITLDFFNDKVRMSEGFLVIARGTGRDRDRHVHDAEMPHQVRLQRRTHCSGSEVGQAGDEINSNHI